MRANRARSRYAFLGDFVGYGADPGWVVDLVLRICVAGRGGRAGQPRPRHRARHQPDDAHRGARGDRLDALAARRSAGRLPACAADVRGARQPPLRARQRARARAVGVRARRQPRRCAACWPPRAATRSAATCTSSACSTPAQTGRAGEFVPRPGAPIKLRPDRQWLVIPGSAGQPRDGNPAAAYAVFDDADVSVTYHRVPYDHNMAAEKIRAAGLPLRARRAAVDRPLRGGVSARPCAPPASAPTRWRRWRTP